jgi:DisA bacterial checkpoint controller nucleotide-binding
MAIQEGKGAQLIFSEVASVEADRLLAQSIKVQPVKLTHELFNSLCSIDGGVLIDLDGTVFAAGVILDGIASTKGNSARGSRFNSAVRYIEHFKDDKPTMIVVISEDRMIDLMPDLMPQISHSEILAVINSMRNISNEENLDRGYFYQAMDWLWSRRFYLRENECIQINDLKHQFEALDQ